jgi:MoxR-like ATPase
VLAKRGGNQTNESLNEAESSYNDILKHPDTNVPNIGPEELHRRLRMVIRNKNATPLLIWGAPGIAKTAIITQVLQLMGNGQGQVIDFQLSNMSRDDWSLPDYAEDQFGQRRAVDLPKMTLPLYRKTNDAEKNAKGNDIANQGEGGILFFDELSRAEKGVQAVLLKLVNERHLGDWYLGDKWVIVSASNRQDDDPLATYNMSTALASRFSQVNFIPSFESWRQWASGTQKHVSVNANKGDVKDAVLNVGQWKKMIGKMRIDPRILDFIEFNMDFFYTLKPESTIFASPRTWEAATKNINDAIDDETETGQRLSYNELLKIIASDVGVDIATEFMTFMRLLQSFTQNDIREVLSNPEKAKLPTKAGKGYEQSESNALISIICSYTRNKPITPKEWENYNIYLARLDNPS